jgi:hypothetical protein
MINRLGERMTGRQLALAAWTVFAMLCGFFGLIFAFAGAHVRWLLALTAVILIFRSFQSAGRQHIL